MKIRQSRSSSAQLVPASPEYFNFASLTSSLVTFATALLSSANALAIVCMFHLSDTLQILDDPQLQNFVRSHLYADVRITCGRTLTTHLLEYGEDLSLIPPPSGIFEVKNIKLVSFGGERSKAFNDSYISHVENSLRCCT